MKPLFFIGVAAAVLTLTIALYVFRVPPTIIQPSCLVEYRGRQAALSPEQARLAKKLFDEYEQKFPGITTTHDRVTEPGSEFTFTQGRESIKYLVFLDEEPFMVEIEAKGESRRRVIIGDNALLVALLGILDGANLYKSKSMRQDN